MVASFGTCMLLLSLGRFLCASGANHHSLAQVNQRLVRSKHGILERNIHRAASSAATCAPLSNQGSHFTIDIEVGTPGQKFSVVADTGSDSVLVPSCICKGKGVCREEDRCFQGTNSSSTFKLKSSQKGAPPDSIPVIEMLFGSGPVSATIATDVVRVGELSVKMHDGVLLMIDHQLNIPGAFEGILGLGQPRNETELKRMEAKAKAAEEQQKQAMEKVLGSMAGGAADGGGLAAGEGLPEKLKKIIGAISGKGSEDPAITGKSHGHAIVSQGAKDDLPMIMSMVPGKGAHQNHRPLVNGSPILTLEPHEHHHAAHVVGTDPHIHTPQTERHQHQGLRHHQDPGSEAAEHFAYAPKSFLQNSNVSRFSMCFNDNGRDGALHLGTPEAKQELTSVGLVHWGLDFQGISVGNKAAPVKFCSPTSKTEDQRSACGGIPDSGTTLFMAPKEHIDLLYEDICDSWERCRKSASEGLERRKAELAQLLLMECDTWMTEDKGLEELPKLHFNLAGAAGEKQVLALDGADYILESEQEEVEEFYLKASMGFPERSGERLGLPKAKPAAAGRKRKVCVPAFSPMGMNTMDNGPIWILGAPFFFKYTVGYSLGDVDKDGQMSKTGKKPAISFTEQECGCDKEGQMALFSEKRATRRPRKLHGKPHTPSLDLSRGL